MDREQAARQNHRVHLFDQVAGPEQVRLPGARRGTPDGTAAHRPVLAAQHHRDAGAARFALGLAHANAVYVSNIASIRIHMFHLVLFL